MGLCLQSSHQPAFVDKKVLATHCPRARRAEWAPGENPLPVNVGKRCAYKSLCFCVFRKRESAKLAFASKDGTKALRETRVSSDKGLGDLGRKRVSVAGGQDGYGRQEATELWKVEVGPVREAFVKWLLGFRAGAS